MTPRTAISSIPIATQHFPREVTARAPLHMATHGAACSIRLKGAPYYVEHGNPCSIKHLRPDQIRVSPRSTSCCASILRSRLGVVLHMRYLGVLRSTFSPAIRLLVDALRFLRAIWPLSGCAATCLSRPCMVAMEWFQLFHDTASFNNSDGSLTVERQKTY